MYLESNLYIIENVLIQIKNENINNGLFFSQIRGN